MSRSQRLRVKMAKVHTGRERETEKQRLRGTKAEVQIC